MLEQSLEKYIPDSRIGTADFQEDTVYIIDRTERPVQPDTHDQKTFYSGKKKTHTLKNIRIVSTVGFISWLGKTHPGKVHDKVMVDRLTVQTSFTMLADLGFQGWKPKKITLVLPRKKPGNTKKQKKGLTMAQKDFNTNLAGKRVGIENGLAHVNVLRIVKAKNRNYRFGFRENLMKTACGLYNFRKSNADVVQKQEIMC